jgi:hypothetical protein
MLIGYEVPFGTGSNEGPGSREASGERDKGEPILGWSF